MMVSFRRFITAWLISSLKTNFKARLNFMQLSKSNSNFIIQSIWENLLLHGIIVPSQNHKEFGLQGLRTCPDCPDNSPTWFDVTRRWLGWNDPLSLQQTLTESSEGSAVGLIPTLTLSVQTQPPRRDSQSATQTANLSTAFVSPPEKLFHYRHCHQQINKPSILQYAKKFNTQKHVNNFCPDVL